MLNLPKTEKDIKNHFNSKSIIEFTQDIKNTDFILYEAVSKEQKEKGQREMWKMSQNVMNRVQNYFDKKWENPKNLKNKKIEQERINEFKEYFDKYEPSEKSIEWFKSKMGTKPSYPISTKEDEENKSPAGFNFTIYNTEFIRNFNVKHIKDGYLNGFNFSGKDINSLENIIWKFIIMHEQGHLYKYLIDVIEKGRIMPVPTAWFAFDEHKKDVNNSEIGANAYAIDNMYRKDRREFLKNFKTNNPEKLETLKDAYSKDLNKKSKTYQKTLDSINKQYFNY
jgi:hypothetical protein